MYVLHTLARHGEHLHQRDNRHAQTRQGRGRGSAAGGRLHRPTIGQNTKNQPITMGDITDSTGGEV